MAARMQTRVYRSLLVQAGGHLNGNSPIAPEQVEMIYWYADFPSDPARFPCQSRPIQRDWDAITGMIHEISRNRLFSVDRR